MNVVTNIVRVYVDEFAAQMLLQPEFHEGEICSTSGLRVPMAYGNSNVFELEPGCHQLELSLQASCIVYSDHVIRLADYVCARQTMEKGQSTVVQFLGLLNKAWSKIMETFRHDNLRTHLTGHFI